MKHALTVLAACLLVAAGLGASFALATPPAGGPPGQGECEHGNSGQECKPDPQPTHGEDCDQHGNNGGVNEDHCLPETTPTDTTPTETTPTETTPTTPTETTPTTPSGPRCPPGMTPTAGKDGNAGNDECEFPKTETTPSVTTTTTTTPPAATPPVTTTTTSSTVATQPPAAKPPVKPKPAAKPKPQATPKPKLTGNPKVDKCKPMTGGTLNCKGVVVVPGSG